MLDGPVRGPSATTADYPAPQTDWQLTPRDSGGTMLTYSHASRRGGRSRRKRFTAERRTSRSDEIDWTDSRTRHRRFGQPANPRAGILLAARKSVEGNHRRHL